MTNLATFRNRQKRKALEMTAGSFFVLIISAAHAVPQSPKAPQDSIPLWAKDVCAGCISMVDDAKAKLHNACPGEAMSDCDVKEFKTIVGNELFANCTKQLKALPNAVITCSMCAGCTAKADAADVEKFLKMPSSDVCAAILDGESCDDLPAPPSGGAALLATQQADLHKRQRNSRRLPDAVTLKTGCM